MKETLVEHLPDPSRMVHALSQIGYKLEHAVADLVDNSISAGATSVLIRFLHDGEKLVALAIADDGKGMTEGEICNAMKFGSTENAERSRLGKFGMGLKLASLSHSEDFSVFTKRGNRISGKRWTVENLASGWMLESREKKEIQTVFSESWGDLDLDSHGTVVLWERLTGFQEHKKGIRSALSIIERRLRLHLGLTFHRFLEDNRLQIKVDQQTIGRRNKNHFVRIESLNPFGYEVSGNKKFPIRMKTPPIKGVGCVEFDAHIWPSKSEAKEYRLGKRASSHQGFYIYRNDRLIQAGGWNGVVHDDSEPHSSLARISLNLDPKHDQYFGLNVQKSAVVTPIGFQDGIREASSESGIEWEEYRKLSIETYRQTNKEQLQPTPGIGFPSTLKKAYEKVSGCQVNLRISDNLETPIELDIENKTIRVASSLKNSNLPAKSNHSWHAFTILLFETFSNAFTRESIPRVTEQKLHTLNRSLEFVSDN